MFHEPSIYSLQEPLHWQRKMKEETGEYQLWVVLSNRLDKGFPSVGDSGGFREGLAMAPSSLHEQNATCCEIREIFQKVCWQ